MHLIDQIDTYIKNTLVEGMSREQVLYELEKIGRVNIRKDKQVLPDGLIVETADIYMCMHHLNNPLIFLKFKPDEKLDSIAIYDVP